MMKTNKMRVEQEDMENDVSSANAFKAKESHTKVLPFRCIKWDHQLLLVKEKLIYVHKKIWKIKIIAGALNKLTL